MTPSLPARRVQRVRHELRRRDVEVARVERLGPSFVAVTFSGDALADFVSLSFDDHVKFMFPGADGELIRRDYTPRRFDPEKRELTLEFALHDEGPASDWARKAAPGQRATIGGPRGSMIIPLDYAWHLLVGDASALPAIHRRLEELPAGTRALVIAHVADPKDRRALASAAKLDVHWVNRAEDLVTFVGDLPLPPGDGFVWCAGEASEMSRLRQILLVDKGHPREAARIAAYWKKGASEFHENLE
ncbi:siderophore-interacting protein [Polyangium jinanense]|uniref:Siderophore-interacting protein n=1 Tax=Polyangium jinanense TaxID=2829994 RepID=A0A9X3XCW8_9BACT|nr:siderophore-interacting protein [Polyangium jinanense]MDC3958987.1 siderophore-interacting protein [Polyangium jinanense]MDC3986388.1 siderophore-interacting protein [Polyangium jinanense]